MECEYELGDNYLGLFPLKPDFSGEKLPRTGPNSPAIFLRSKKHRLQYFFSYFMISPPELTKQLTFSTIHLSEDTRQTH
jgi:hypothetical protein